MPLAKNLTRLCLAAAIFGSLAGCTVAPVYPNGYRPAPTYVNTYPAYGGYPGLAYGSSPSTTIYYQSGSRRHYDDGHQHYRNDYPQQRPRQEYRQMESPRGPTAFESAAKTHRDVRRSLGLPRLPGMP